MQAQEQRRRFAEARVARLGTVTADGLPHLVPVVFAVVGDVVYSAVDDKPKSTRRLRRLDHVAATGRATLLVDAYDEDWTRLWWVRVDGAADVTDATSKEGAAAVDALVDKYSQYTDMRPGGPVIAVRIERWAWWAARDNPHPRAG
ncbi:TIGR03668 family PPOX class F420-dependent oxidoreductase [Rhodococcus spelaei]|uniref:TIGR03668 family PPOX class F420-dependent oxidoreductase n=1 Tax=Rhodococcus spelaei TaxID=2546320 RepID=A0A541B7X8_9NOCA|nr:TIGR03668 family PPOX class F420-dependent oxidoreductase [Rhodococcus spelaei]TQF68426.1 TIGR03668 family PPOX class F420-dependent oxidoreductase [Rhodococcus spelaei]